MMIPTTLDRKTWKKWLICPALALLLVLSSPPVYASEQQIEQTETPTVTQDAGSESAESVTSSEQDELEADELEPMQPIDPQESGAAATTDWTQEQPHEGQVLHGGYVGFKNKDSENYLTIPNGSTSAGTNVCQQSGSSVVNAHEFYLSYTYNPDSKRIAYFTIYPVDADGNVTSTRVKSASINASTGLANVSLQYFMPTEMTDRWQIEHYEDNYYIIHMASKPHESGPRYVLTAQSGEGSAGGSGIYDPGNVFVTTYYGVNEPDDSMLWQICADGMPMDINSYDISDGGSYDLNEAEEIEFYYIPMSFNQSLTWQSSNSYAVTTPNNLGLATANSPGKSTIKMAIIGESDLTYKTAEVYVRLPNGVYYLNSVVTGMRWDLEQNKVDEGNPVQVYGSGTSDTEDLNYLYKFHYLGNGLYSIRSMMKNAMGVTWTNGNTVVLSNIGTTHIDTTQVGLYESSQWYLDKNSRGYILYAKVGNSKTITAPAGAESGDNLIISSYAQTNANQAWEIRPSAITVSKIGLSGTFEDLTSQNTYEIMPHYISHLDAYNGDAGLEWFVVSGSDKVRLCESFGTIEVIGAGDFYIAVWVTDESAPETDNEIFDFHAYPTPSEGDWFIENAYSGLVLSTLGQTETGSYIEQTAFSDHVFMEWELEYVNQNYFRIKSKAAQKYLSSQGNSVLSPLILSSWEDDYSLWKIERTANNRYKITNKAYESGNWVLATPSSTGGRLYLYGHTDDANYCDEWYLNISGDELTILVIADYDRSRADAALVTQDDAIASNINTNVIIADQIAEDSVLCGMKTSEVFVSRSHGSPTCIQINDMSEGSETIFLDHIDLYDYDTETALVDLSNCELILFIGCSTASNENGKSITDAAVDAGAAAAIGFTENIGYNGANDWMRNFLWYYQSGAGLSRAASKAAEEVADDSLGSYRIVRSPS